MNKPEISLILPAIRRENWDKVYDSIQSSTKRNFELVICGPYPLTDRLQNSPNVKYVKDYGSPSRASNIAAELCEGKLITWIGDDALLLPEALDKNIDLLYSMESINTDQNNYKNVVVAKYYEGKSGSHKPLQPDEYFKINGADCTKSQFISNDWWIFNVAIMYSQFFEELGGWDCNFEHLAMANIDIAVRSQFLGANVKMSDHPLLDCDHGQSDHGPIEIGQITHDEPLFQSRYRNPNWVNNEMKLDIKNWKNAPSIWTRRFKEYA